MTKVDNIIYLGLILAQFIKLSIIFAAICLVVRGAVKLYRKWRSK